MNAPRNRLLRGLIATAAMLFGRSERRAETRERIARERSPEYAREQAGLPESRMPGEPLPPGPAREQHAEKLEEVHQRIRRRRAEPPPTDERDTTPRPGLELVVVALLLAASLAAGGFIVFYVAFPDTQLLGLTLGGSLALLAAAAVIAGKRIVPQEKVSEEYHYYGDSESQEDVHAIVDEAKEGVSRRKLIAAAAGTAGITLGAAAAIPAASLGPNVGDRIYATPWRPGRLLVGLHDEPISADQIDPGEFLTAFPEGASRAHLGSPLILVQIPPEELRLPPERREGAPEGILAFSKICPHAGCAISMYRHPLYDPVEPDPALVCPCHYSTFDPRRGGHLLFGPAGRDLPQLPLRINPERHLEAAGDFYDPIGPSYGGIRLR